MRIERLARSANVRQAALQAVTVVLAFLAAGALARAVIRRVEVRAAYAEIVQMEDDLSDLLRARGVDALRRRLDAPGHDPSRVARLEAPDGARLAGALPPLPAPFPPEGPIWTEALLGRWPDRRHVLALRKLEPGGLRLTVGEDLSFEERKDDALLLVMALLAAALASLGLAAGALAGGRVLRRVDAMVGAVDAYAAGDRRGRPSFATEDEGELSELARALTDMMAREDRLVEGLRQVSTSIAHDLRRPLAHHNQAIAQALAAPADAVDHRAELEAAAARVEEVLVTFQALLHIAELEAGAPGLKPVPVDLNAVARNVVAAYAPAAEEGGRTLSFVASPGEAMVRGEARVLGRMIANLVENAIVHTPPGTRVSVVVSVEGPSVSVTDDGLGVPERARARLLERFYREETSRLTPGSGLGLSLAAAACQAFGGALTVHDAAPGLRVVAEFSQGQLRSARAEGSPK